MTSPDHLVRFLKTNFYLVFNINFVYLVGITLVQLPIKTFVLPFKELASRVKKA